MDLDDTDTGLSSAQAQRSRLLQSTSVLDSSSARLDNAQAMSAENEAVGAGILQSLFGQRIQLETARDGLDEADGSIGRAQGTIKKMVRQ
jgi:vesicle transport through interaction with t-SNAREs protein 1